MTPEEIANTLCPKGMCSCRLPQDCDREWVILDALDAERDGKKMLADHANSALQAERHRVANWKTIAGMAQQERDAERRAREEAEKERANAWKAANRLADEKQSQSVELLAAIQRAEEAEQDCANATEEWSAAQMHANRFEAERDAARAEAEELRGKLEELIAHPPFMIHTRESEGLRKVLREVVSDVRNRETLGMDGQAVSALVDRLEALVEAPVKSFLSDAQRSRFDAMVEQIATAGTYASERDAALKRAEERGRDADLYRRVLVDVARKLDVLGADILNLPGFVAAEVRKHAAARAEVEEWKARCEKMRSTVYVNPETGKVRNLTDEGLRDSAEMVFREIDPHRPPSQQTLERWKMALAQALTGDAADVCPECGQYEVLPDAPCKACGYVPAREVGKGER